MGPYITPPARLALFERDGWACYLCGRTVTLWQVAAGRMPPDAATLDHVLPLSRGGDNSEGNLKTACASCNGQKGARTPEEFRRGVPKLEALLAAALERAAPDQPVREPLKVTLGELLASRRAA